MDRIILYHQTKRLKFGSLSVSSTIVALRPVGGSDPAEGRSRKHSCENQPWRSVLLCLRNQYDPMELRTRSGDCCERSPDGSGHKNTARSSRSTPWIGEQAFGHSS